MRFLRAAIARLTGMFTRFNADDDLRAELESHIDMETAENVRRGMRPDEARRQANLASGGVTQAVEAVHDRAGIPWIESIAADIKYAFRSLRHARAFTAVVIITLALGIGANTAIFSVVRAVLLKPLPNRDGDRLVYLRQSADEQGKDINFSVPEVRDLRNGVPAFSGIAEYSPWNAIHQRRDGAVRIDVALVTGNYFEVMGLAPILGRLTRPSDDGPGVPPVAVLSYGYWVNSFGADSAIVGRTITLDKKAVEVIGVLQQSPFFPDKVDAFLNMVNSQHHLSASMVEGRTHRMTAVMGRVAPTATLGQAQAEIDATYTRMLSDHKEAYNAASHFRVEMLSFREALGERARLTLWLLMGAAAFVLIIAAANVANLTLMRGVRRQPELIVRAALGAGVGRLRRLLLAENLLLTLGGAAIGALIAVGGVKLLVAFASRFSTRADEIALDGVVLAFTVGIAIALALLMSLVASLPKEGTFAEGIASGLRRVSGSLKKQRLQRALVVVQIAVSVMLLAGAGLLTRTMIRLSDVSTGLTTEEVLSMQVALLTPTEMLTNPAADGAAKERYEQMRTQIAALPGVISVGVGSPGPLRRSGVRFEVKTESRTHAVGEALPYAELRTADPHFFDAAGVPMLSGRSFQSTDGPTSEKVVVVNRQLAEQLFPNEDPIGRRIAWTGDVLRFTPISGDWRTIVGVVANTQDGGPDIEHRAVVFMPFAQMLAISGSLVVRADQNVANLTSAATRIVRAMAPTVPIEDVQTIAQIRDQSVSPRRLNATLISLFSALAVLIAAVGIAGVLAFSVSARTNEIGIRMSLGADEGRVQRMILGEGGLLLGIGLMLGIAGAYAASGVISGMLFGVAPHDPVTFVAVALAMAVIGLAACWIPALRASRIDPAITMRAS